MITLGMHKINDHISFLGHGSKHRFQNLNLWCWQPAQLLDPMAFSFFQEPRAHLKLPVCFHKIMPSLLREADESSGNVIIFGYYI